MNPDPTIVKQMKHFFIGLEFIYYILCDTMITICRICAVVLILIYYYTSHFPCDCVLMPSLSRS